MSAGGFRDATAQDRRTGNFVVAGFLLGITAASGLVFLLEWPDGMMVWLVLVMVSTVLLARWNATHSGYRCAHCGHEFAISTMTELVSSHGTRNGGWRRLRCPRCDVKSRMQVLAREQ